MEVSIPAEDQLLELVVQEVDFELRLYEDATEIFDAGKDTPGKACPVQLGPQYVLRYNNNDGSHGSLRFTIEAQANGQRVVRKTVSLTQIEGGVVFEIPFKLVRAPANVT
jgi:hypothetical protein